MFLVALQNLFHSWVARFRLNQFPFLNRVDFSIVWAFVKGKNEKIVEAIQASENESDL
jgi:hypothetical protein